MFRLWFFLAGLSFRQVKDIWGVYAIFQFAFEFLLVTASGVMFTQSLEWISQIYIILNQKHKRPDSIYSDHIMEIVDK